MPAALMDLAVRAATLPIAGGILANGAEEVAMDLQYFARGLHRRDRRAITWEELEAAPPRRIAIMVASWHEAAVIEQMLEHNLRDLDYDLELYDIFCGTYQNDPETQRCVDAVCRRRDNVHKVVVPNDGPTSKADCLNWIYQGIVLEEKRRGQRFDILLMQDSEDVIHPLALRLYSLLIPEHDFVQTPVFSLQLPRRALVGATYMDDFAEHHLKDMLVREAIGGMVPSAGVGSAFARDAFEEIALAADQKAFNTESLTEDYEIGLKLRLAGKKVHFACRALQKTTEVPRRLLPGSRKVVEEEYIATREYFPDGLRASIRQRSRWITGIALQTWQQIGWRGGAAVRFCLWRDRKALITNSLLLGAYLLLVYAGGRSAVAALEGSSWGLAAVAPNGSALWWLLMINLGLLAWRIGLKMLFVGRLYGAGQALLSAPRLILGNIISLAATARAVVTYVRHRFTGKALRWVKTEHAFPSVAVLQAQRRRLGEFLVDREELTSAELDEALRLQRGTHLRLGEVIAASGMLTPRAVVRAVSDQLEVPAVDPAPYDIPLELLRAVPEPVAEALDALPVGRETDGRVRVAMARPPEPDERRRLADHLGAKVTAALADPETIRVARWKAYRRLLGPARADRQRLGEALIERGRIDRATLDAALDEQHETRERLGELLVRRGLVDPTELSDAISAPHPPYSSVSAGDIDIDELRRLGYGMALFHQLAPLRGGRPGKRVRLASPFPVHPRALEEARRRLGGPKIETTMAPGLEVRIALALASQAAWPSGLQLERTDLDGEELAALARESDLAELLPEIAHLAGLLEISPIEALESSKRLDAPRAARLRAAVLGLGVAIAGHSIHTDGVSVLPPELALRHRVRVLSLDATTVSFAAPRPTPILAHRVAELFIDRAVAWSVMPASISRPANRRPAQPIPEEVTRDRS